MLSIKLNILFDDPFWIGIFEVEDKDGYKVCKETFGSEPKDYDIYKFILSRFYTLNFSNAVPVKQVTMVKKKNPKRVIREIKRETKEKGIGTKAQLALKKQYEENKEERKKRLKEKKELMKLNRFQLKQKKKIEKHKGH